jgi:hypothetical protein
MHEKTGFPGKWEYFFHELKKYWFFEWIVNRGLLIGWNRFLSIWSLKELVDSFFFIQIIGHFNVFESLIWSRFSPKTKFVLKLKYMTHYSIRNLLPSSEKYTFRDMWSTRKNILHILDKFDLSICRQDKGRSHHAVWHVGFVRFGGLIPKHPSGSLEIFEKVAGRTTLESGCADAVP